MNTNSRNTCRRGRHPVKQGPRPLLGDQGRIEKLTTRKLTSTKAREDLKIAKNTLTVGTWNVQTLWTTGKLQLLRNEMKKFRYDVVDISEVRWTRNGEASNRDFIWSGEHKTHKKAQALIRYNPVSLQVITARFDAAPYKITVIHAYAPTTVSSDEDIKVFYGILEDAITRVHKEDILIITSDWNAKIGSNNTDWRSVMGRYRYGDKNERGERLLEFAVIHSLYACNTRFEQKPQRKCTWASPGDIHKNMVHLMLIQKRWKLLVINCKTF